MGQFLDPPESPRSAEPSIAAQRSPASASSHAVRPYRPYRRTGAWRRTRRERLPQQPKDRGLPLPPRSCGLGTGGVRATGPLSAAICVHAERGCSPLRGIPQLRRRSGCWRRTGPPW